MRSPSWPDSLSDSSGHAYSVHETDCSIKLPSFVKNLGQEYQMTDQLICVGSMAKHFLNWLRVVYPIKRQLLMKTIKQF